MVLSRCDWFCLNSAINKSLYILSELLRNSLDVINEYREGKVYISTQENDKEYLLMIMDSIGKFNEETKEKCFEIGFSTKPGHNGLGLSFSQKVMEAYEGSINVNYRENLYTQFVLSFPKVV